MDNQRTVSTFYLSLLFTVVHVGRCNLLSVTKTFQSNVKMKPFCVQDTQQTEHK